MPISTRVATPKRSPSCTSWQTCSSTWSRTSPFSTTIRSSLLIRKTRLRLSVAWVGWSSLVAGRGARACALREARRTGDRRARDRRRQDFDQDFDEELEEIEAESEELQDDLEIIGDEDEHPVPAAARARAAFPDEATADGVLDFDDDTDATKDSDPPIVNAAASRSRVDTPELIRVASEWPKPITLEPEAAPAEIDFLAPMSPEEFEAGTARVDATRPPQQPPGDERR
jgi:hypothetical protein